MTMLGTPPTVAVQLDELHPICTLIHNNETCCQPAHFVANIHVMDNCNDPELTIDGDRVELLCPRCFNLVRQVLVLEARKYAVLAARLGGYPLCMTCGRPKHLLSAHLTARPL
jgi:hypothetical protein